MTGRSRKNSLWFVGPWAALALFSMLAVAASLAAQGNAAQPWDAPASAAEVKNPVSPTPQNVSAGKDLYEDNCLSCHGEKGAGDGIAAQNLSVKPANFADAKLKSETDGSLFWKITTGKAPMPSWKDDLSETQRWQLVDYIRTFAKAPAGEKSAAPDHEQH